MPKNDIQVVHVSTVHRRVDTRIRLKQMATLHGEMGGGITLLVQDGLGAETDPHGFEVRDVGPRPRSRLLRITVGTLRMARAVHDIGPRIIHFHDPELLPLACWWKLWGAKVIYDVHEDVPRQVLDKAWIPRPIRHLAAFGVELLERVAGATFDRIIGATPVISRRFPSEKTFTVQNFPILDELRPVRGRPYGDRPAQFIFVGGLSEGRGAREMVGAIAALGGDGVRLTIAGEFSPAELRDELEAMTGWDHVNFVGWADRTQMAEHLGESRAGLVLFHPAPNHINAQPNKMFEYMAAGLPIIASDFPLWREIVQENQCGILVDPLDPGAIKKAMQWILENPEAAKQMGERGQRAVTQIYNWEREAENLKRCYAGLIPEMVAIPGDAANG